MSICQSTLINRVRVPQSAPLHGADEQSARKLRSCGPVQGLSRRSVTATLRSARHSGRTLVSTKFMNKNNVYKPTPENLRGTTRIQLLVVRTSSGIFLSVHRHRYCERLEVEIAYSKPLFVTRHRGSYSRVSLNNVASESDNACVAVGFFHKVVSVIVWGITQTADNLVNWFRKSSTLAYFFLEETIVAIADKTVN